MIEKIAAAPQFGNFPAVAAPQPPAVGQLPAAFPSPAPVFQGESRALDVTA